MLRIRTGSGLFILISIAILLQFPLKARADQAQEAGISNEKGEYDFSWLDPEKKIYVVQNRKYTKAKKMEFSASGGFGFGEPYRSSWVFVPRASYYFNEDWGISALGLMASNSENKNIRVLKTESASALPSIRDVRGFVGGSVVWVPFYAKINTFNKILYIDWAFEAGVASVSSEIDLNTNANNPPSVVTDSKVGFFWGTSQKFFINRNFAIRWDLLGVFYKAQVASQGLLTSATETLNNYYFTVGASFSF